MVFGQLQYGLLNKVYFLKIALFLTEIKTVLMTFCTETQVSVTHHRLEQIKRMKSEQWTELWESISHYKCYKRYQYINECQLTKCYSFWSLQYTMKSTKICALRKLYFSLVAHTENVIQKNPHLDTEVCSLITHCCASQKSLA
jgi:hypothetical protein